MSQERLLDTAVDQFGREGFDGASTRKIAAAANVAMSAITYHYGGKHGLYLAAADHIAAQMDEKVRPLLERMEADPGDTPEDAIERLLGLFDQCSRMIMSEESRAWSRFIVREQMQPTEAFDRLYSGFWKDVTETCVAFIARVRPDLDDLRARILLITLFGQMLAPRTARASVLRILGRDTLDEEIASLLRQRMRTNALAILAPGDGP